MKNYIGIDLGTTNSAICSFDGSETRIWKSPDQNDVTPSAIFIDRRGNKFVGRRAYDSEPASPGNAAKLFKRLMGTSTPIQLPAIGLVMSPEECSAEILKTLFGYLTEEIREDLDTGTVITVPAAFNQMQKDATMQAAEMAGIGKVALMQEPVAAVMSVLRARDTDGLFMVYDLGGGTLDIAIAESIHGRINLLAHGGIAICGGRNFDLVITDNVVRPWLFEQFNLPDDFSVNPTYQSLLRLAIWATEKAKIDLSAREEAVVSLSEAEVRVRDLSGNEIYLDVPLSRDKVDSLISKRVGESIAAARETLQNAGLTPHDLERIVFVGGPTQYKPLRDKVAFELGIPGSTDVNPMTAVAEGASLFAESIDWSTKNRSRRNSRGQISSGGSLALTFNYVSRTPDAQAKIAVQLAGETASGCEFQIDSVDTGWTSGRLPLKNGTTLDVALPNRGENTFKAFVFDSADTPVSLKEDKIIITRTAAVVDAIPASHSVCVEALDRLGGRPTLVFLVRAGDSLPKKGKVVFKAGESLKAGAYGSLNFNIWEGEIDDPITDNRAIGVLKISGSDFEDGVIAAGADLECEFEMLDSGRIILEVSVPCIGSSFRTGTFYSRQEGQLDYTTASLLVIDKGKNTLSRIDTVSDVVDDPRLELARQKVESAVTIDQRHTEVEKTQEAMENILEARRLLAKIRKDHSREIRQLDHDGVVAFFNDYVREYARPAEESAFDNLARTAQRSIDKNDRAFEYHLDELRGKNFEILWRQDWFVVDRFKRMLESPHSFADGQRFKELSQVGMQAMQSDDIEKLRNIVVQLSTVRIGDAPDDQLLYGANIIKG